MPEIDPNLPIVRQVVERVELELMLVRLEQPGLTPDQALGEARRRSAGALRAAAEALRMQTCRSQ
jgi:hypothetical protein